MSQKVCAFEGQVTKSARLAYLLHLPQAYDADRGAQWPLILFLHGMGERGDDLDLVKKHGLAKLLDQDDGNVPVWANEFIVVSPQCPLGTFWPAETGALNVLLEEIVDGYAVDTSRVYLTGLSMGGYGTWHLASEQPGRFAAIAPICGGGMFFAELPERIEVLKNVPVWAFHGARDRVVNVAESADLVYALQECGGDVRFTIYPDAQHDSWTRTYENPEFYEWLLAHSKP